MKDHPTNRTGQSATPSPDEMDRFLDDRSLAQAFDAVCAPLSALTTTPPGPSSGPDTKKEKTMKIAIPVANGKLCAHFGHCEHFAVVETEAAAKAAIGTRMLTPPPHEPGVLPRWLHEQGVTHIIAGGMGQRAQSLFAENGIVVVVGAPAGTPEELVAAYLAGTLKSGVNACDH